MIIDFETLSLLTHFKVFYLIFKDLQFSPPKTFFGFGLPAKEFIRRAGKSPQYFVPYNLFSNQLCFEWDRVDQAIDPWAPFAWQPFQFFYLPLFRIALHSGDDFDPFHNLLFLAFEQSCLTSSRNVFSPCKFI
jgi:hypothetical protein